MLPDRIRLLRVSVNGDYAGDLSQESQIVFRYGRDDVSQPAVGLLMRPSRLTHSGNTLFPVMDQNLPEGYLFARLRERFPKQPLTAMHLLALIGDNGIGRLGYRLQGDAAPTGAAGEGAAAVAPLARITRRELLSTPYTPQVFEALISAYLSTGVGVSGLQPKILLPTDAQVPPGRAAIPVPDLIVKAGTPEYPGLAANEFLCLSAARRAGLAVARFELSDDGQLLLLDRFDIAEDGSRLGFEDVASLMGLTVRDTLSDRKYRGSYQQVASVLRTMNLPAEDLHAFFEQVAFTVMVRNGDGHLKNYGVIYGPDERPRLSPMYDVVTTAIYRYARLSGGQDQEDKTLALKLFAGRNASRVYPTTEELLRFGREVCGVERPGETVRVIAQALADTLHGAKVDQRIAVDLLAQIGAMWEHGLQYAREVESAGWR